MKRRAAAEQKKPSAIISEAAVATVDIEDMEFVDQRRREGEVLVNWKHTTRIIRREQPVIR